MLILEEKFKRHYSIICFVLGRDNCIQAFGNKRIPVSYKTHLYIGVLHMLFSKHMEFTCQIGICCNISSFVSEDGELWWPQWSSTDAACRGSQRAADGSPAACFGLFGTPPHNALQRPHVGRSQKGNVPSWTLATQDISDALCCNSYCCILVCPAENLHAQYYWSQIKRGVSDRHFCSSIHQYIVNNSLLTLWRYWDFLQVRMVFFVLLRRRLKTDERTRRDKKDVDRGRQRDGRGRGRGRPEVIQSHSIFEQGPAEMMAKRKGKGGHQGRIWVLIFEPEFVNSDTKWH